MSSSQPASRQQPLNVTLKPVTSEADAPQLANINEKALEGDPLKEWLALYTGRTEWSTTVEAVTGALNDPTYRLVKAVVSDPDSEGDEKIVGFVHWMCGYVHLEKGYNSAQSNLKRDLELKDVVKDVKDPSSDLSEELAKEASFLETSLAGTKSKEDDHRARRLKKGEVKYIETRNHYISAIRGKKHIFVRRIMVLPEYHGREVGKQLLKVVTDSADQQKIVCWLFSKPAGEGLYTNFGFKVISVTGMDEPEDGFVCPASKGMMRAPQPVER